MKYIDINLNNKEPGWKYLGRYVFNGKESDGKITYNVSGISKTTHLLFYSDANCDWNYVYKNRDNCALIANSKYGRVISDQAGVISIAKTPAPSYWYVAVANCDDPYKVDGYVHLEDMGWDSSEKTYNSEFDFAEQDETEVITCFALLFGALLMQQLFNFYMKMRPKRHMFVWLVTISTGLLALGYTFRLIYCTRYSTTGKSAGWRWIADLLCIAGDVLLVLVALFIGQGYLISHPVI